MQAFQQETEGRSQCWRIHRNISNAKHDMEYQGLHEPEKHTKDEEVQSKEVKPKLEVKPKREVKPIKKAQVSKKCMSTSIIK
jgi:hypothetical protein